MSAKETEHDNTDTNLAWIDRWVDAVQAARLEKSFGSTRPMNMNANAEANIKMPQPHTPPSTSSQLSRPSHHFDRNPNPPDSDSGSGSGSGSRHRSTSPTKRQRIDDIDDDVDQDGRVFNTDLDRTPRSRNARLAHRPHLPQASAPSLPPSNSSWPLSSSSGPSQLPTSKRSVGRRGRGRARGMGGNKPTGRAVSPAKRTQSLQSLEKPVYYIALGQEPFDQLPEDVHALYDRIFNIAVEREGVLPPETKPYILGPGGRMLKESWFRQSAATGTDTSPDTNTSTSVNTAGTLSDALAELDTLRSILNDAHDCLHAGCSEAAWNLDVHGPLLKLAMSPLFRRRVDRVLVTTARIATPFVPTLSSPNDLGANRSIPSGSSQQSDFGPISTGSVTDRTTSIGSKMVDFVLALTLDDEDKSQDNSKMAQQAQSQSQSQSQSQHVKSSNPVRQRLACQPLDLQFINRTQYEPLRNRPIAVSIETKAFGLAEEGRVQLGVWIAAWHIRLESLLSDFPMTDDLQADKEPKLGEQQPREQRRQRFRVITVPLILVVEHQWRLYFACDRGDRLELVDAQSIGDTQSLLGLYTIIAVLRELRSWIDGPFRAWMLNNIIRQPS